MGLNSKSTANKLWKEYKNIIEGKMPPEKDFIDILNKVLDEDFQKGTLSFKNVDITGAAKSLKIPKADGTSAMTVLIGLEISKYWAKTIALSGTPQNTCTLTPSVIISVVNNSAMLAPAITAELSTLITAYAETPKDEVYFKKFIDIIYNNVKKLKWVVSEMGTNPGSPSVPCPSSFTVSIS